jgi:CHAT domain
MTERQQSPDSAAWAERYDDAVSLVEKAQRAGRLALLDEACDELAGLTRADAGAGLAAALSLQAVALATRYTWTGDRQDLNRGVLLGLRAASHCGRRSPAAARSHRSAVLGNLANVLRTRFEVLGDFADLADAVVLGREALAAQPADTSQECRVLNNLSLCLRIRGQLGGSPGDIAEAIVLGERALALEPSEPDERAAILSNLGGAYQVKHERSGDMAALGQAIDYGREALRSAVTDARFRVSILSNLGTALQIRAERLGHSPDITEAIDMGQAAVQATPADDPARIPRLANLATAYLTRFDHHGEKGDLDAAVDAARRAVAATPETDPAFPGRAANLSAALRTRSDRTGDDQDLDDALAAARRAVAAAREMDTVRTAYLSGLGTALRASYRRGRAPADAVEAEAAFREALDSVAADDPDRAALLSNLGATLYEHYEHESEPVLVTQAEEAFRRAAGLVTARTRVRVAASASWGRIAAERGRWPSADEGMSLAVGLLGSLVPADLDREDQQRELRRHVAVAADAAACALERGDAARALVLLEAGRGLLLRQSIDARSDLAGLAGQAPELARRFGELRRQLDLADSRSTADVRRRQLAEFEEILARIRQVPGFADFLRMPHITELLPLAEPGPVVLLNVSELRSDALIMQADGVRRCALPEVSPGLVQAQVASLLRVDDMRQQGGSAADQAAAEEALRAILAWLWESIARPVLAALGLLSPVPPGGRWPRVWWVPTGLLSFLPLHAAQGVDGSCALDRVVSSFALTLHTLGFARRRLAASELGMLAVTASSRPGLSEIPAARREVAAVARLAGGPVDILADAEASRAGVLRALPAHSRAHFACHATTDPVLPSKSALMVHGAEPLTVADVAQLDLSRAELAFLSACTTTRSAVDLTDESIHLTSAFQLAGYRHVVGTLWPVTDPVAVLAACAFYAEAARDWSRAGDRSAVAIHLASQRLRQRFPGHPSCWAGYIHAGG